ncbi:MAG: hypothetical protein ACI8QT_001000 [Halioglobus sp.]|jgi:hypothetical protein
MGNMTREGSASDGDLGKFPGGEFPTQGEQTASGEGEASDGTQSAEEPGFGGSEGGGEPADAGIPDLSDEEPSLEDAMATLEEAMGDSNTSAGRQSGRDGASAPGSTSSGAQDAGAGRPSRSTSGQPAGIYGTGRGGTGPLTTAEQVAILDGQLERGAGEFDAMILEEQTEQRRTTREQTNTTQTSGQTSSAGGSAYEEGGVADAGGYSSTGGGMGGVSRGGAGIPENTAKYPPPDNIPSGNDDDVVARQLREAAMREPDPALREKLWDEYRKYKGIQ